MARSLSCARLFSETPEVERSAELALQRHAHILENGKVRKDGGNLEGPRNAAAGDVRRFLLRDILAAEKNRTRSRLQKTW